MKHDAPGLEVVGDKIKRNGENEEMRLMRF